MTDKKSQFLISAPSSNSGKTTLTLALLRALKNRGLRVQPFKCGPDYIDTIHHTAASGRQSINLDTFMSSDKHVKEIYSRHTSQAEVSVTEGVMGLFDGADKMQGSSAEIAHLLNIPVILVVNAKSMAYSAAPLLFGFKNFDKRIKVAGVIFNFVNTESHYRFLKDACVNAGVEALGYFPQSKEFGIPSRHLGLSISTETNYEQIIENLAEALTKTVDLNRLLDITKCGIDQNDFTERIESLPKHANLKISVARDKAFSFIYQQNIEVLSRFGQITWFSPMHDETLPETDFLYLPGGYPELFAKTLSENFSMKKSIQTYCQNRGPTYAECGGLMYLGKAIVTSDGAEYEMSQVLDFKTSMKDAKMTLGYRIANINGLEARGHEFHYSILTENRLQAEPTIFTNAKGIETETKMYRKGNTYASYMHVYWGDNEGFLKQLIASIQ